MELSNINKLSMSIALAIISEKYTFARYRFKQGKNTSIYEIKSIDDDKSYLIGFDEEKDYSLMFGQILQNVLSERFPKRRLPTMDELEDDSLAGKTFVDIVNSYSLDEDRESEKYKTDLKDFNRIAADMMELCDIGEEVNYLSLETRAIVDAIYIVDKTLMHRYSTQDIIKLNILDNQLRINKTNSEEQVSKIESEYPWVKEIKGNQSDYDLEKSIAKTLTYMLICSDIITNINYNENLENTLFVEPYFNNLQTLELVLHDRETLRSEFEDFRDNLYSEIMSRHGFTDPKAFTTDIKESLTFAILKDNKYPFSGYIQRYIEMMEENEANMGRDQRILGAITLNIMSLYGLDDSLTNLTNLEKFNNLEVSEVFEKNYNMLRQNPTIAYQLAKKFEKKHELGQMYSGMEVYIDPENLDPEKIAEMPQFIQDMIKEMIEEEAEDFDPTADYPYPDEDEFEQ